jgi:RNA polymerase sigma-70 factor (ECF subfamily)
MYGDDAALLNAWITARDAEAFKSLTQRYSAMVYSTCLRVLGNSKDAEETTQECFLKLAEAPKAPNQNLGGWLHAVARNSSISRIRSDVRREKREKTYAESQKTHSEAAWKDIVPYVDEAIAALPTELRDPIIAHFLEDSSHREIAQTEGVKREAITYRIKKGVEEIRTQLKRKGVIVSSASLASLAQSNFAQAAPVQLTGALGKIALGGNTLQTSIASAGAASGIMDVSAKVIVAVAVVLVAAVSTLWINSTEPPGTGQLPISDQVESFEPVAIAQATTNGSEEEIQEIPILVNTVSGRTSDPNNTGGGEIFGLVVDQAGEPVVGAEVVVDGMLNGAWLHPDKSESRQTQATNEKGEYRFNQLPAPYDSYSTTYKVMAFESDKAAFGETHFSSPGYSKEVNLNLTDVKRLSGVVVDKNGSPIPSARIYPVKTVGDEHDDTFRAYALRTVADQNGRFTLRGLLPQQWDIVTTADEFAPTRKEAVMPGKDHVEIVLHKGAIATGEAVDIDSNEPAPGVHVLVMADPVTGRAPFSPWNTRLVTTNEDGIYTVTNMPENRFRTRLATLYEDTYVYSIGRPVTEYFEIGTGGSTMAPPLEVMRGGEISGHVYDPTTGQGMKDVLVTIYLNRTISPAPAWTKTRTGSDGKYHFAGVKHGEHKLFLEKQRQQQKTLTMKPQEIVTDFDFIHTNSAIVTGRVIDTDGNPVPHAQVHARSQSIYNEVKVMSDRNGRFEVRGITPASDLMLTASTVSARSIPFGPEPITREGIRDVTMILDQPRTASVTGVVVDGMGRGIHKAQVIINHPRSNYSYNQYVRTDEDGSFKFAGMIAGDYKLNVLPPEQQTWIQGEGKHELTLAEGERVEDVQLVYAPGGATITGLVLNMDGQPIRDARVDANGPEDQQARTDHDGRYTLTGLGNGPHYITVGHTKYSRKNEEVSVPETQTLDFVLDELGMLAGHVVSVGTGDPIEQFELAVRSHAYQYLPDDIVRDFGFSNKTFRDADGAFFVDYAKSGPATVFALAKGFAPGFATVADVKPGELISDIEIRLEPGYSLNGRVRDQEGNPVGGARIFLGHIHRIDTLHEKSFAISKPDGTFSADSLPDSVRIITIVHSDFAPTVVPLTLDENYRYAMVTAKLMPGGTVRGQITVNGAVPQSDQHYVSVQFPTQRDAVLVGGKLDPKGGFRIDGVLPGEVAVRVTYAVDGNLRKKLVQEKTVYVERGESVDVDFDFANDGGIVEGVITHPGQDLMYGMLLIRVHMGDGEYRFETGIYPDGSYRVENVPAGRVTIQYPMRNSGVKQYTHELGVGGTVYQDIEIEGTHKIDYEVTHRVTNITTSVLLLAGDVDVVGWDYSVFKELYEKSITVHELSYQPWNSFFSSLDDGEYTVIAVSAKSWTQTGIDDADFVVKKVNVTGEIDLVRFDF